MLYHGRYRDVPISGNRHGRTVGSVDGKSLHTIHHHRFDVGDVRNAKGRELLLR